MFLKKADSAEHVEMWLQALLTQFSFCFFNSFTVRNRTNKNGGGSRKPKVQFRAPLLQSANTEPRGLPGCVSSCLPFPD